MTGLEIAGIDHRRSGLPGLTIASLNQEAGWCATEEITGTDHERPHALSAGIPQHLFHLDADLALSRQRMLRRVLVDNGARVGAEIIDIARKHDAGLACRAAAMVFCSIGIASPRQFL